MRPLCAIEQHGIGPGIGASGCVQSGEEDDGEFQPFAPWTVITLTAPASDSRTTDLARSCLLFALALGPGKECAQGAFAGCSESAGAVDEEAVTRPAPAPLAFVEGQLPEPAGAHELLDERGRGGPFAAFVETFQDGQRVGDAAGRGFTPAR